MNSKYPALVNESVDHDKITSDEIKVKEEPMDEPDGCSTTTDKPSTEVELVMVKSEFFDDSYTKTCETYGKSEYYGSTECENSKIPLNTSAITSQNIQTAALTSAERQRRYRLKRKADKEKHEEYLKKSRERYHSTTKNGPFTGAERQRQCRLKRYADKEKHEEYLRKLRERYHSTKKIAPPSTAEKQRRCRLKRKADQEKYEEYLRKAREHYHATKKLVKDMNEQEKSQTNQKWRIKKMNYRQTKLKEQELQMDADTPAPFS